MFESSTLYILDDVNSIAYGTECFIKPTSASTTCWKCVPGIFGVGRLGANVLGHDARLVTANVSPMVKSVVWSVHVWTVETMNIRSTWIPNFRILKKRWDAGVPRVSVSRIIASASNEDSVALTSVDAATAETHFETCSSDAFIYLILHSPSSILKNLLLQIWKFVSFNEHFTDFLTVLSCFEVSSPILLSSRFFDALATILKKIQTIIFDVFREIFFLFQVHPMVSHIVGRCSPSTKICEYTTTLQYKSINQSFSWSSKL